MKEEWALRLMAFYLRRAAKKAEAMTPEMIADCPKYVKYVLPNVIHDCKRNADWCDSMVEIMRKGKR